MSDNSLIRDCGLETLNSFRKNNTMCDVILEVDFQLYHAHKIILMSCSEYFSTLFTGAWADPSKQVYSIPGVSAEIMEIIVSFCYTRDTALTDANVKDVLVAADMLMMPGLMRFCYSYMERQLCVANCIGVWQLLQYCQCPEVETLAHQFILREFEALDAGSSEFKDLSLQQLSKLLQDDCLVLSDERIAIEAILKWIFYKPRKRQRFLPRLLKLVRMGMIPLDKLILDLEEDHFIVTQNKCGPIIEAAKSSVNRNNTLSEYCYTFMRPRLPKSVLFVTGGKREDGSHSGVLAYDNSANMWLDITSQISGGSSELNIMRSYHGCVALDSWVYLIGGCTSIKVLNSVVRFHAINRVWQQVAHMSRHRQYVSVAVLNSFIYALGGENSARQLRSAERYDPDTNRWTPIAPMKKRRSRAGAAALEGKLYVCGGHDGQSCLDSVEIFNPELNQWTSICSMRVPRCKLGVVAFNGCIFAMGGELGHLQSSTLKSVESFDPNEDEWCSSMSMQSERSSFGIAVLENEVLVVGGLNWSRGLTEAEIFPDSGFWHQVAALDSNLFGMSCCAVLELYAHTAALFPRGPIKGEMPLALNTPQHK